jgi:hypothetical protein
MCTVGQDSGMPVSHVTQSRSSLHVSRYWLLPYVLAESSSASLLVLAPHSCQSMSIRCINLIRVLCRLK